MRSAVGMAAIFALARSFRTPPRGNRLALPSFVCSGIMAASLVPMLLQVWPGLTERILILAGMLWITIASRFLHILHTRALSPSRKAPR